MLIHLFLFDLATSLTKLSVLAMVRRLTTTSSNKVENAIVLILAALITINCLIFILVEIFQCRPISSTWTLSEQSDYCINDAAHLITANIINTVTDFIVAILPIRTTMTLQLSKRQRVIVASLFGIGLIASSVGIARTYFIWLLFTTSDYDTTWQGWNVWLASLVELHLGIICASIPATKPFFAGCIASMIRLTKTRRVSIAESEAQTTVLNEPKHRTSDTTASSLSSTIPCSERSTTLYHRAADPDIDDTNAPSQYPLASSSDSVTAVPLHAL
ncbi:hypothetical protein F4777DRAFT_456664 [Nemania sp. FL0916]|nr:hypothetical protein F4777DRAFT_456664 [Nemania sp. FL0916]